MSGTQERFGQGTAWLVADQAHGDYLCYWYAGKAGDHLLAQARVDTPALAVAWGRLRSAQVRIRLPDARTYWAGIGTAPPGFAGTWADAA